MLCVVCYPLPRCASPHHDAAVLNISPGDPTHVWVLQQPIPCLIQAVEHMCLRYFNLFP
uniref:Uncharacterized protein n=1 Tax=Anguilla anguilla TaxID=7936 RepID=A0A0E9QVL9_ANGAN